MGGVVRADSDRIEKALGLKEVDHELRKRSLLRLDEAAGRKEKAREHDEKASLHGSPRFTSLKGGLVETTLHPTAGTRKPRSSSAYRPGAPNAPFTGSIGDDDLDLSRLGYVARLEGRRERAIEHVFSRNRRCYTDCVLNPTPRVTLLDSQGRPYFLWDCDMTLDEFQERLRDADPDVRAYLVGKLMRQAKPDDVFSFVSLREIRELWPRIEPYLGRSRSFWTWLLEKWDAQRRSFR